MGSIKKILTILLFLFSLSILGGGCTGEGGTEAGNPGPEIESGLPVGANDPEAGSPSLEKEPGNGSPSPAPRPDSDSEDSNEEENQPGDL